MATCPRSGNTLHMVRSGTTAGLLAILVGAPAMAQAPTQDQRRLAALRAGLADLPIETLPGATALQILDWRSGTPLPDAIVVVVPETHLRSPWPPDGILAMQRRWLEVAADSGRRIGLDKNATAMLPPAACCVVVHGEDFTSGHAFEGTLSPCPPLQVPLEVHDPRGRPVAGWPLPGTVTDADGRALWSPSPYRLAASRHALVPGWTQLAWGMLPPGEGVVDLRSPDAGRDPVPITTPATTSLEVVGLRDGAPAELGHVQVYWWAPFENNASWRNGLGGAAMVIHHLPVGIPLFVRRAFEAPQRLTLSAGPRQRHTIVVPAPGPWVRFRLVDDTGRVLRGTSSHEGDTWLDGERGELRVPMATPTVFVRLQAPDGEEWSCAPFPTPQAAGTLQLDGGDLVLQPGSRSEYCRGLIFDTDRQPVQTSVWLSDGHAVWASTESDAQGRFRLCIGPWFAGPMTLRVPMFPCLTEPEVERGDEHVVLVVDSQRPSRASLAGRLQGLSRHRLVSGLAVEAKHCRDPNLRVSTHLQAGGRFQLPLEPGDYDVQVAMADGTVLLAAAGLTARAHEALAPDALQRPLPASHRAVQLRFVDPQGRPFPLPDLTDPATGTAQAVIPAGGTVLDLPQILQRVPVSGDTVLVLDPVVVDVDVAGLPAASPWVFGLAVGAPGHEAHMPIRALTQGRGRMFVPRGVPLRAALFATRYATNGAAMPAPLGAPTPLGDFVAEFTVPTAGRPGPVRLLAPASLAGQLAARAAEPAPR